MNFSGLTQTLTPRNRRSSRPSASAAGSMAAAISTANNISRGSACHSRRQTEGVVAGGRDRALRSRSRGRVGMVFMVCRRGLMCNRTYLNIVQIKCRC